MILKEENMDNINEAIVHMFIEIKKKLDDYYIFKEKRNFSNCLLKIIYKIWGKYIKSNKFNYNHIASSFNKVYFWKNLLKSMIFFDKYYDLIGEGILDVGCGAAPVSIAIASLVQYREGENNISINLIDRSKNQLSIAKDLAEIMSIRIELYTEANFDIKYKKYSELVIFSYFFCEQEKHFLKILFNNREKFSKGFVVIDYQKNIMKIKKYFKDNGDDGIVSIVLNYLVPEIISEFIHDKEVNVYACFYRP